MLYLSLKISSLIIDLEFLEKILVFTRISTFALTKPPQDFKKLSVAQFGPYPNINNLHFYDTLEPLFLIIQLQMIKTHNLLYVSN